MRQENWDQATREGLKLQHLCPDEPGPFLQTAYCLHEMGQTEEALHMLGRGPACLQAVALFHYNSACYLAVLGRVSEAKGNLAIALALDGELEENARTDPDLTNLRS
jgi:Flp pilus assembly protein TadD